MKNFEKKIVNILFNNIGGYMVYLIHDMPFCDSDY